MPTIEFGMQMLCNPTLIWGPRQEELPRISACTLHFQKTIENYIFVVATMGLSSFKSVQWAPKDASFLQQSCVLAVQGHPRSMILVPIESAYATSYLSPLCPDMWLWSYLAPFLRYVDLFAKNCLFLPLFDLALPLPMFPLEFRTEVNREETRVMGLSSVKTPGL